MVFLEISENPENILFTVWTKIYEREFRGFQCRQMIDNLLFLAGGISGIKVDRMLSYNSLAPLTWFMMHNKIVTFIMTLDLTIRSVKVFYTFKNIYFHKFFIKVNTLFNASLFNFRNEIVYNCANHLSSLFYSVIMNHLF